MKLLSVIKRALGLSTNQLGFEQSSGPRRVVLVGLVLGLAMVSVPGFAASPGDHAATPAVSTIETRELKFFHNGNIRLAYSEIGSGPLMIFVHGFPDTEGTYDKQVEFFSRHYRVVTPRLRGFPPSSVPLGVENYKLPVVAEDIRALLVHLGEQKAIIVGHDWGGGVAQAFMLKYPDLVSGLAIMNVPLIVSFDSILGVNPEQQRLASYTVPYIRYQRGDAIDTNYIVRNIRDPEWRLKVGDYLRSQPLEGMFSYYKANYPAPPYRQQPPLNLKYQVPLLVIWGAKDEYFSPDVLNDAWRYTDAPLTLLTIPGAGHWVHRDAPDIVNQTLQGWVEGLPALRHPHVDLGGGHAMGFTR